MIIDAIWRNYTDVGCSAYASGNLELAEKMFLAAADQAKALRGTDIRIGISYNNLALLYQRKGDLQRAVPLYKRAIAALEAVRADDRTPMAAALDSLAEVYASKGQYAKARPLVKRVVLLWEKQYGSDCLLLVPRLLRLAWIYCQHGRYEKALEYRQRAEAIRAKVREQVAS